MLLKSGIKVGGANDNIAVLLLTLQFSCLHAGKS